MEYRKYLENKLSQPWPYPVRYEQETRAECDVLVVGGGLAGCFAAIQAAKRGAKVIVVDKAPIVRSGCAGTGIDHWYFPLTHPTSTISPDEMISAYPPSFYSMGPANYITYSESWPCIQDFEEYGLDTRDTQDEFVGAPFRDPKTKLMFAYDYKNKTYLRLKGANLKPVLYKKMKSLGIRMYDRVMSTMLLTEGGKQGGRVIGATGVNTRTGEFLIFNAKATILSTGQPIRLWEMAWEKVGSNAHEYDPNWDGDGDVMAWKAGAKLSLMEYSQASSGGRRYPSYGTGNANNTWFPCTIVDSNGKEIPWVDRDNKPVKTVPERNLPVDGQRLWLPLGIGMKSPYETCGPLMVSDLEERIMKGEYKLPFYADMTDMPDYERRAIFGLMVGNEGKTAVPILKTLRDAGFNPEVDMLMVNVLHPKYAGANEEPFWDVKLTGINGPNMRDTAFGGYGGLVVNWDMRTSLEGLYAAGAQVSGVGGASFSAATGRYSGRTAATWAKGQRNIAPNEAQISAEKNRIYSFVRGDTGYGWKEVQLGLCRVMQDYCGDYKNREVMEMGLWWLNSIRENELHSTVAANPHELGRTLGAEVRLSVCEIILQHCLARKSSTKALNFERLDYPEHKEERFALCQKDGKIISEDIPDDIYTREGTYSECYQKHGCLEEC
jgi:succinate dehydrogenase/fumarate reductase flavoprotein subunit